MAAPLQAGLREDAAQRHAARIQADLGQLLFGKQVVRQAKRYLGTPYRWGGKAGDSAFDCSGYAQEVYLACGVSLPASALAQMAVGTAIERGAWQAGDLLFFSGRGSPWHVALYEGGGRMLHAPGTGKTVRSSPISANWERRYLSARRISAPRPLSKTASTTPKEHP